MDRLRLGLIGTGHFVQKSHLPALAALADQVVIAAVCSEHGASAAAVSAALPNQPAVEPDYRALLARPDLDAVSVAVPIHRTYPIVREALLAGKPVISEKPIAETVAQAADLLQLAVERGVLHLVAENVRHQARFLALRQLLVEGRVGQPLAYDLQFVSPLRPGNPYLASVWRRESHHRGGWLLDSGVHATAALRLLSGTEAIAVEAVTLSTDPDRYGHQPDTLWATFLLADGTVARLGLSVALVSSWTNAAWVFSRAGTLALYQQPQHQPGGPRYREWVEVISAGGEPLETLPLPNRGNGVREVFAEFLAALTSGQPARCTAAEAARDLQLIDAALAAAERGGRLAIPRALAAPWRTEVRGAAAGGGTRLSAALDDSRASTGP
ncbi:MAG: Gfo/Idh/MocA family oxidoreductase [Chloroflexi bacterium]|nr:Gfo/Idh/MocA family oxidoreductase [Chloroflexota bacterium]